MPNTKKASGKTLQTVCLLSGLNTLYDDDLRLYVRDALLRVAEADGKNVCFLFCRANAFTVLCLDVLERLRARFPDRMFTTARILPPREPEKLSVSGPTYYLPAESTSTVFPPHMLHTDSVIRAGSDALPVRKRKIRRKTPAEQLFCGRPPVVYEDEFTATERWAAACSDWMLAYTYFDLLEPLNGVLRTFMDECGERALLVGKRETARRAFYNLMYLPEDERLVMSALLRNKSPAYVAERGGIPVETVLDMARRANLKLRDMLQKWK